MKTIFLTFLTIGSITCFSSCTTVEQKDPPTHTSTTTTEQTTTSLPVPVGVETQTTRSY
jgi:hypothetical protein